MSKRSLLMFCFCVMNLLLQVSQINGALLRDWDTLKRTERFMTILHRLWADTTELYWQRQRYDRNYLWETNETCYQNVLYEKQLAKAHIDTLQTRVNRTQSMLTSNVGKKLYWNSCDKRDNMSIVHLLAGVDFKGLLAGWVGVLDTMCSVAIEKGCDPDYQDPETGSTALHIAAQRGSFVMVTILLKYKADPSLRDNYGQLPVDVATDQEIKELLTRS